MRRGLWLKPEPWSDDGLEFWALAEARALPVPRVWLWSMGSGFSQSPAVTHAGS